MAGFSVLQHRNQKLLPRAVYRPEIDGLRAIAVLAVMGFHAGWPGFSGGYVGVDVFFVISGFVITQQVCALFDAGRFGFLDFIERRARRLVPALLTMLVVTSLASAVVLAPSDLESFSKGLLSVLSFTPNIYFWRTADYFGPSADFSLLLHTWSLGLEEQFYLLFPLLLLPALRRSTGMARKAVLVTLIVSFGLAVWGTDRHPVATFYLLPTRAWELLLGAFLALGAVGSSTFPGRPFSRLGAPLGVACILLAVGGYNRDMGFPWPAALLPTVGAALVLLDAQPAQVMRRSLAWRPLAGIGLISYGAYLWHQPMLALLRYVSDSPPTTWAKTGALAMAMLVAGISWRWIEQPVRKAHGQSRASLVICAPVTALIIAVSLWAIATQGIPERWGTSALEVLTLAQRPYQENYGEGRCFLRSDQLPSDHQRGCAEASVSGGVAVWGDSHAAALSQGLRVLDKPPVRQYTASGCPPLAQAFSALASTCNAFSQAVLLDLRRYPPDKLLIHARWSDHLPNQREESLRLALTALRRDLPHTSISLVGPVPRWYPTLPLKLARGNQVWQEAVWGPDAIPDALAVQEEALMSRLALASGLDYQSVRRLACPTGPCRQVVGEPGQEAPFAWDDAHLTAEGALWLAQALAR